MQQKLFLKRAVAQTPYGMYQGWIVGFLGVLNSCHVYLGKLFTIWCTFVLRVRRSGRILANVAIWVDFSRSKWSLKILHTEFRQGTPRVNCASII